jgi:hypothetical protein
LRAKCRTKRLALVDGIKYQKIGDEHYYAQELFQQEELMGYLRSMLKYAAKSVFEHVVYESGGVERTFYEQLEKNKSVKVYAKLPAWFKVPTPLGTYNPDWAVLSRLVVRSGSISSSKPRAVCSQMICATMKRPRLLVVKRISKRWPQAQIQRAISKQRKSTT